jgi:hypothetical protein
MEWAHGQVLLGWACYNVSRMEDNNRYKGFYNEFITVNFFSLLYLSLYYIYYKISK